jgi:hypothetical protein
MTDSEILECVKKENLELTKRVADLEEQNVQLLRIQEAVMLQVVLDNGTEDHDGHKCLRLGGSLSVADLLDHWDLQVVTDRPGITILAAVPKAQGGPRGD